MNCDRSRPSLSNLRHQSQNARRLIATAWAIELPGNADPEEEPPIFLLEERARTLDIGERDLPGNQ
ncbi:MULTISPECIES: hypothetical protein [unclassified Microcoleus]|uniref:hypothetical protein n=1 Tax=unclassified Microcoleus TaxID=2642155 RepID=UPI002FD257C4